MTDMAWGKAIVSLHTEVMCYLYIAKKDRKKNMFVLTLGLHCCKRWALNVETACVHPVKGEIQKKTHLLICTAWWGGGYVCVCAFRNQGDPWGEQVSPRYKRALGYFTLGIHGKTACHSVMMDAGFSWDQRDWLRWVNLFLGRTWWERATLPSPLNNHRVGTNQNRVSKQCPWLPP